MSTLETVTTKYTKQYLPGYTGHVPAKNDLFGLTAGDANRLILRTSMAQTSTGFNKGFSGPASPFRDTRTFIKHRDYKALIEAENVDSVKFGNNSRFAKNWISGPNHQIYNQHVPHYTGHIPGITAENMFSKSYAKTTAVALHGKFPRGHDLPKKDRYRSQSMSEYNPLNFRRYSKQMGEQQRLLVENPKIEQNKDFQDYKQFIQGKNVVTINALGRAGRTTHKEGFPQLPDQRNRNPGARSGSQVPQTPFDPMKSGPVASEKKYQQNIDFARLSDGFKRILCNTNDEKEMKIPIVGFAGHQKGIKARNFYGKAFRETSLASKKVLRSTLSP